jgi:hypothetical protein
MVSLSCVQLLTVVVVEDVDGIVVVVASVEPDDDLVEVLPLVLDDEPVDDELGVAVTVGQPAASSVFSCARAAVSADSSSVSCCSSAVTVKLAWSRSARLLPLSGCTRQRRVDPVRR